MSFVSLHDKRSCFQWTVNRPLEEKSPRNSRRFFHRGKFRYFYLRFCMVPGGKYPGVEGTSYTLTIIHRLFAPDPENSTVHVHVEDKKGRALKLSDIRNSGKAFIDRPGTVTIWWHEEAEILKEMPDFLSNGIITFLVTFSEEVELKISRTRGVLNRSTIQVVEKSVQTSAHMNILPCYESLSQDLLNLLEHDKEPDVVLICSDSKFKTHRKILCARSKVFADMLKNDPTKISIVGIDDMDLDTMFHFVRYLYSGELPNLTAEVAIRLYEAADRYAVRSLMKRCVLFLEENLNRENACEMLVLANLHLDTGFKESVMEYILQHKIHLQQDNRWMTFCSGHSVLANEVLNLFCRIVAESNGIHQPKKPRLETE